MRSFVLLAALAGIAAAYARPSGLKNRQNLLSFEPSDCAAACVLNYGGLPSCVEGAGHGDESDQCICDKFAGPYAPEIEGCIQEECSSKDLILLDMYLQDTCRPLADEIEPRSAPALNLVPDAGTGDGELSGDLQGSMLGDGDGELGGDLGGSMAGGADGALGGDLEGSMAGSGADGLLGDGLGGSMTGDMAGKL